MKTLQDRVKLRSAQIAPNKDAAHPFDIEHGTETGGYLSPAEIVTGHAHDAMQYGYSAIAPSVFRQVIARWSATLGESSRKSSGAKAPEFFGADVAAKAATHKEAGRNTGSPFGLEDATQSPARNQHADNFNSRISEYSFVDIGAGKGRAVLLASQFPWPLTAGQVVTPLAASASFRSAIGVELSAELAGIAKRNIEIWKRAGKASTVAGKIHVLNQDALKFCWPRTSLLVFMYNPFACEMVEQLLERLEMAQRRTGKNAGATDSQAGHGAAVAWGARGLSSDGGVDENPQGLRQELSERPELQQRRTAKDGCATQAQSAGLKPGATRQSARPIPAKQVSEQARGYTARTTIDLLYANPTCADVVSKRGKWVLLWTDRIDMDAADIAADPYGTTFDRVSCYRLRP